jgi:hypothetical protein
VASKILTRDQAQSLKDKAVRFAENVLDDPDLADDIADDSLDDWGERKKITLIDNPVERSLKMANGNGDPRTKAELLDEIDRLQDQVDDLEDALDAIGDIASGGPLEEEDDQDEEDDADARAYGSD